MSRATRRDVLRKVGLAGSLIAIPTLGGGLVGQVRAAESPGLGALIDAHRAAFAALSDASDEIDAAFHRRRTKLVLAPVGVYPDGRAACGAYDVGCHSVDSIRLEIDQYHDGLATSADAKWMASTIPEHAAARATAIEASRQRAYAALDEAVRRAAAEDEACGVPQAAVAFDYAAQAEYAATVAVLVYRPADDAEARAKADYLASTNVAGDLSAEPGLVDALLAALCTTEGGI